MTRRTILAGILGVALVGGTGAAAAAPPDAGHASQTVVFFDDFSAGFSTSGPGAKWVVPRPTGVITVAPADLHVAAAGANPVTGEPAFTATVPQDGTQNGIADHGKWSAQAIPPGGATAFPVPAGGRLSCQAAVAVRTFGTDRQPFGTAVRDPQSDPRLANAALVVADRADGVLFDFTVTNRQVWARYESVQLPSGGSSPASFAYAVPVANRASPAETDKLAISYDSATNQVVFAVNDHDVLRITRPGTYSLNRQFLAVDHGGVPRVVVPAGLSCGVGMFTLLDDRLVGGPDAGLVRLAGAPGFYLDPLLGSPQLEQFVDDQSLAGSRLWGQGAQFDLRSFTVLTQP
jgi:hypothetical protein